MARFGGRKQGSLNKITSAFKEAVYHVYHDIGGDEQFAKWAREYQSEFYRIASRLIPAELSARSSDSGVTVIVQRENYNLENAANFTSHSALPDH